MGNLERKTREIVERKTREIVSSEPDPDSERVTFKIVEKQGETVLREITRNLIMPNMSEIIDRYEHNRRIREQGPLLVPERTT